MYSQINVKSNINDYSVIFSNLEEVIKISKDENTITIIDQKVAWYFPQVINERTILVETSEELKTWDGLKFIFDELLLKKANVTSKLLVIGGGILQDAAGFCASVYCRGISYILVPTTLLSQIDSCVGGKTSINYALRKNILGTFYPPKEILICDEFLYSLPYEDFCSGLGELFKFDILRNRVDTSDIEEIMNNKVSVTKSIYESLQYKISILEIDEFDKKERKFLNFGHTFGHALEITSNHKLSHGFAVVIGCLIALKVSEKMYGECACLNSSFLLGIKILNQTLKLQKEWFDYDSLMECVKSDKKNDGNINMVLIKEGLPTLQRIKDCSIIREAINETIRLCN